MRGKLGVRAVATHPVEAAIDDCRIEFHDIVIAEAESIGGTCPQAVDHHRGVCDEAPKDRQPFLRFQVERDALLSAVPLEVLHVVGRKERATESAAAGLFNLDHLGTQVGEMSAERVRREERQLEHANIVKHGSQPPRVPKPVCISASHQRDRLDLGELLEAPAALLASEPALLEPTERAATVEQSTRGHRPPRPRSVARIGTGVGRSAPPRHWTMTVPVRICRATLKPRAALWVMTIPASPKSESLAIRTASS